MPCASRGTQVLHGERQVDGEPVVIKVRRKQEAHTTPEDEQVWRAGTERLLRLPRHGGVAGLWEVLEDSEAYYVIMERAEGSDLFETMCREGLLPLDEVMSILRQLLRAIAHLHSHGLVYRDLKLDNVMFARRGRSVEVKLVDFDTVTPAWSERQSRDVLGTDQYIAPEAYDGRYSPASDVFALGALAYWLLAGRPPFKPSLFDDVAGENRAGSPKMQAIRRRLLAASPSWSAGRLAELPSGARGWLCALLAPDPARRPGVEEALAHPWLAAARPAPQAQPFQWWQGLVAAGGVDVAAGALE